MADSSILCTDEESHDEDEEEDNFGLSHVCEYFDATCDSWPSRKSSPRYRLSEPCKNLSLSLSGEVSLTDTSRKPRKSRRQAVVPRSDQSLDSQPSIIESSASDITAKDGCHPASCTRDGFDAVCARGRSKEAKRFQQEQHRKQQLRELSHTNKELRKRMHQLQEAVDKGLQPVPSDSSQSVRQIVPEINALDDLSKSREQLSHKSNDSSQGARSLLDNDDEEDVPTLLYNLHTLEIMNKDLQDEMNALKKIVEGQRNVKQELFEIEEQCKFFKARNKEVESELTELKESVEKLSSENDFLTKKIAFVESRKSQEVHLSELINKDTATRAVILDLKHEINDLKCEVAVERILKQRYRGDLRRACGDDSDDGDCGVKSMHVSETDIREEIIGEQQKLRREHVSIAKRFQSTLNTIAEHYWREEGLLRYEIDSLQTFLYENGMEPFSITTSVFDKEKLEKSLEQNRGGKLSVNSHFEIIGLGQCDMPGGETLDSCARATTRENGDESDDDDYGPSAPEAASEGDTDKQSPSAADVTTDKARNLATGPDETSLGDDGANKNELNVSSFSAAFITVMGAALSARAQGISAPESAVPGSMGSVSLDQLEFDNRNEPISGQSSVTPKTQEKNTPEESRAARDTQCGEDGRSKACVSVSDSADVSSQLARNAPSTDQEPSSPSVEQRSLSCEIQQKAISDDSRHPKPCETKLPVVAAKGCDDNTGAELLSHESKSMGDNSKRTRQVLGNSCAISDVVSPETNELGHDVLRSLNNSMDDQVVVIPEVSPLTSTHSISSCDSPDDDPMVTTSTQKETERDSNRSIVLHQRTEECVIGVLGDTSQQVMENSSESSAPDLQVAKSEKEYSALDAMVPMPNRPESMKSDATECREHTHVGKAVTNGNIPTQAPSQPSQSNTYVGSGNIGEIEPNAEEASVPVLPDVLGAISPRDLLLCTADLQPDTASLQVGGISPDRAGQGSEPVTTSSCELQRNALNNRTGNSLEGSENSLEGSEFTSLSFAPVLDPTTFVVVDASASAPNSGAQASIEKESGNATCNEEKQRNDCMHCTDEESGPIHCSVTAKERVDIQNRCVPGVPVVVGHGSSSLDESTRAGGDGTRDLGESSPCHSQHLGARSPPKTEPSDTILLDSLNGEAVEESREANQELHSRSQEEIDGAFYEEIAEFSVRGAASASVDSKSLSSLPSIVEDEVAGVAKTCELFAVPQNWGQSMDDSTVLQAIESYVCSGIDVSDPNLASGSAMTENPESLTSGSYTSDAGALNPIVSQKNVDLSVMDSSGENENTTHGIIPVKYGGAGAEELSVNNHSEETRPGLNSQTIGSKRSNNELGDDFGDTAETPIGNPDEDGFPFYLQGTVGNMLSTALKQSLLVPETDDPKSPIDTSKQVGASSVSWAIHEAQNPDSSGNQVNPNEVAQLNDTGNPKSFESEVRAMAGNIFDLKDAESSDQESQMSMLPRREICVEKSNDSKQLAREDGLLQPDSPLLENIKEQRPRGVSDLDPTVANAATDIALCESSDRSSVAPFCGDVAETHCDAPVGNFDNSKLPREDEQPESVCIVPSESSDDTSNAPYCGEVNESIILDDTTCNPKRNPRQAYTTTGGDNELNYTRKVESAEPFSALSPILECKEAQNPDPEVTSSPTAGLLPIVANRKHTPTAQSGSTLELVRISNGDSPSLLVPALTTSFDTPSTNRTKSLVYENEKDLKMPTVPSYDKESEASSWSTVVLTTEEHTNQQKKEGKPVDISELKLEGLKLKNNKRRSENNLSALQNWHLSHDVSQTKVPALAKDSAAIIPEDLLVGATEGPEGEALYEHDDFKETMIIQTIQNTEGGTSCCKSEKSTYYDTVADIAPRQPEIQDDVSELSHSVDGRAPSFRRGRTISPDTTSLESLPDFDDNQGDWVESLVRGFTSLWS